MDHSFLLFFSFLFFSFLFFLLNFKASNQIKSKKQTNYQCFQPSNQFNSASALDAAKQKQAYSTTPFIFFNLPSFFSSNHSFNHNGQFFFPQLCLLKLLVKFRPGLVFALLVSAPCFAFFSTSFDPAIDHLKHLDQIQLQTLLLCLNPWTTHYLYSPVNC